MTNGEKLNVYKVYDKIAGWYAQTRSLDLVEKSYLDSMLQRLPVAGSILDLGCGTGKPILEYLQGKNFKITGVDGSKRMIKIAQSNFPSVDFLQQDMRILKLNRKFDGIILWNSFFHLSPDDQRPMFQLFEQYLHPNGILLFTSGSEYGEVWSINHGENLYHSSLSLDEYKNLLIRHQFHLLQLVVSDPDCGNAIVWMAQYFPD